MPTELKLEPVRPEKAIEYWKTRRPGARSLSADEEKKLTQGARDRALTVAGLFKQQQLAAVHEALGKALAEGKTLADFKKEIQPTIKEQGWGSWRVENIFRTNLATAYAAGAWAEIQATKEAFPYLEYVAVNDDRVRPEHAVLNGKIYPVDHEFWRHNFPPNGFGCRCATAPVSKFRAEQKGVKVETEMPSNLTYKGERGAPHGYPVHVAAPGADPGFTQNVGSDWLAGLTPQELEGALNFGPARMVCPVGGQFADPAGPCGLPLDKIDPRHILEVPEILPAGQSDEYYALEFLKAFGIGDLNGSALVKVPGTSLSLPVSRALLSDKATGKLKADKYGRGPYMRLLARTIQSPFEVWQVPAKLGGKDYEALRLIRLFREPDGRQIGGLGVWHWVPGKGWEGATAFTPGSVNKMKNMRNYLEKVREGVLLFREK